MAKLRTLSPEHQKALQQGASERLIETGTQIECAVVRADLFNRIENLLPDIGPRETYRALDEVMGEDWNDLRMAEYDDYESRTRSFHA